MPDFLWRQQYGNLVLYQTGRVEAAWTTHTEGKGAVRLVDQPDGTNPAEPIRTR